MSLQFSEKQKKVITWWCKSSPDNTYDAIICDGAVRSGKTVCMSLSYICWAMARFNGAQFGICGKSVISVRRNVVAAVVPWLAKLGFQWTEKRTENLLEISCCGHTNRFYLFGGYDEKSAALIQGITFAGVLLDEVALMPRSFVEQACARCSVEGSRLWFNCNPEGPQHWFYKEWILKQKQRNALYLHFTMEDNPSLSSDIKRRYRNSYTAPFTADLSLENGRRHRGSFTTSLTAERIVLRRRREHVRSISFPSTTVRPILHPSDFGESLGIHGTVLMSTIMLHAVRDGKKPMRNMWRIYWDY